mgnify:CR=1 FL=1
MFSSYPSIIQPPGKRKNLERKDQLNPDKLVRLLNIKATITLVDNVNQSSLNDNYYNIKAGYTSGTSLINAGYYESTVAVTSLKA